LNYYSLYCFDDIFKVVFSTAGYDFVIAFGNLHAPFYAAVPGGLEKVLSAKT